MRTAIGITMVAKSWDRFRFNVLANALPARHPLQQIRQDAFQVRPSHFFN
jgi:hypothetical protein